MGIYNQLQLREVFHLEFLRWFARKIKSRHYVLKGGVNLRFFFNSFRYSEDIDLDVYGIKRHILLDAVMQILESSSFQDIFKPFGVEKIIPPHIARAKQTETTQRFKAHLITYSGEDLFTKIEFSRRGFRGETIVEPVLDNILRIYKLPPLLIPHYDIRSAVRQKAEALSSRTITQARDVFDLYILSSQYNSAREKSKEKAGFELIKLHEKIFEISFEKFRDTVISYLSAEDRNTYDDSDIWDEIRLKVVRFLEELSEENA